MLAYLEMDGWMAVFPPMTVSRNMPLYAGVGGGTELHLPTRRPASPPILGLTNHVNLQ